VSLDAGKEVGPDGSTEKAALYSRLAHRMRANHKVKAHNESFPNAAQFNYLGTTFTTENCMQTEVRECLLPLGPESFAIQFAINKHGGYNFAGCVSLARNLVLLGMK